MVMVAPTPAEMKTRYPEFAQVPDATVSAVLGDTVLYVDETWLERDRKPALLSLGAHMLAAEGEPRRSADIASGGTGDVSQIGAIKRDKVGDVETEYHPPSSGPSASSGGGEGGGLGSTSYGRQFLALRRRNFPAVLVV